jgi:HlyD family secretion protein
MKNSFIQFIHQPHKVAVLAIIIALAVGIFGYMRIHRVPSYTFVTAGPGTISNGGGSTVRNLTLGFLAGGRIASVAVKTGDTVQAGEVLATLDAGNAQGALAQAKAAYESAQANYQKVVNGATGTAIDVAKAAVNTAQVNLDQVTKQQASLVANAQRSLLNSTVIAKATNSSSLTPPTISGTYTASAQGTITISITQGGITGAYFTMTGIATGTGDVNTTVAQPLGTTGLSILFPSVAQYAGSTWEIDIPNTNASNYLANYNAYQSALTTQTQAVASAQATLDQAQAALTQLVTAARPEDVATAQAQVDAAQGSLEIAQAAYNNTIITAPGTGTVTAVSIAVGQIATPNVSAIQLLASVASQQVAVMVPQSAIVSRNGLQYVEKKTGNGVTEVAVTLGAQDASNAEILSGIVAGDQVATH